MECGGSNTLSSCRLSSHGWSRAIAECEASSIILEPLQTCHPVCFTSFESPQTSHPNLASIPDSSFERFFSLPHSRFYSLQPSYVYRTAFLTRTAPCGSFTLFPRVHSHVSLNLRPCILYSLCTCSLTLSHTRRTALWSFCVIPESPFEHACSHFWDLFNFGYLTVLRQDSKFQN